MRVVRLTITALMLFWITVTTASNFYPPTITGDLRQIRSANSPPWLAAVGRLVSFYRLNTLEQCSVSLISNQPGKDSDIAITAAHCIDHWPQQGDKIQPYSNLVTFLSLSGEEIEREIIEVVQQEKSPADYAIVRLDSAIPYQLIAPLIRSPYDYRNLLFQRLFQESAPHFASLAGYSSDITLGNRGKRLTYHERCQLFSGPPGQQSSNCISYRGASGGPIVVTIDLGQDPLAGIAQQDIEKKPTTVPLTGKQHLFVGSVNGGHKRFEYTQTLFTEVTYYLPALEQILNSSNR